MSNGAVIVTGASRGIGRVIAEELAEAGHDLVLVDLFEEPLREVAASLEGKVKVLPLVGDVTDWERVQAIVAEANEAFGGIAGLVNNAGVTADNLFVRMDPETWRKPIDINLGGTFHFTRAVAPLMMRQRSGRIVNIASVIGLSGNAGQANYAASKAGVIALTKSVAKELGSRGVTCNAVAPGFIATDMTAELPEKVRDDMLSRIPLRRLGEPKDVAGVVKFLLSPDAAYLTAQTLVVDGGMIT
jgi:3-oxoacyl-[acyl-carrier protein] reductase